MKVPGNQYLETVSSLHCLFYSIQLEGRIFPAKVKTDPLTIRTFNGV